MASCRGASCARPRAFSEVSSAYLGRFRRLNSIRGNLVIFAKAPRLGAVKRRLARDVGALAAWRFQRRCLAALLAEVAHDARWGSVLAVTGAETAWPAGLPRMEQGRGDLGQRMGRAMRACGPGPVVLVGSDIPQIRRRHIAQAFAALGRHDAVFGPANDGGYWLVGLRHPSRHRHIFDNVRWSSEHALADTAANVRDYALLEELIDIDSAADLALIDN